MDLCYVQHSHVGSVVRHGDGEAWSPRGHVMLDTGKFHFQHMDGFAVDIVLQVQQPTNIEKNVSVLLFYLHTTKVNGSKAVVQRQQALLLKCVRKIKMLFVATFILYSKWIYSI